MLDKIIYFSFILIFALVPFAWFPQNNELFEYNKMMLTYFLTVMIVGAWVLKMINLKSLVIKRTPLDIPILLFLGANILSTIFSIDQHTSIWGYYSRSNGGLLSVITYSLLYFAIVANISKEQIIKILKIGIVSGVGIAIWGIFEHFGVSASCVVLRGELNADCWIQDVQARVFATLGQPNWLAAYLEMLIFPAVYFFLTESGRKRIAYGISSVILYLAFTFTYSRGAMLGFLAGIGMFVILSFWRSEGSIESKLRSYRRSIFASRMTQLLVAFLVVNLLFGSALTNFKLLQKFAPPPRPSIVGQSSGTQLENGGTESGRIRLIVWKGAIEVFKHYPIFGSGVETFAYSYYKFRPIEHNMVSEWDFLYNKAHNEYLNYLATTGLVGFATYMFVIITFFVWCIKNIVIARSKMTKQSWLYKILNKIATPPTADRNDGNEIILVLALLASYISYLIQNFFGFSVVIIAIFFYLFPAIAFIFTNSLKNSGLPKRLKALNKIPEATIYRRPAYIKATKLIIILYVGYLLFRIINLWVADTLYASGERNGDHGNVGASFNDLLSASDINKNEPLYRSELGYAAASSAVALEETEATLSGELNNQAVFETATALTSSPNNPSLWRTAFRTYIQLSALDPQYNQMAIDTIDYASILAPTDPKLPYHKGLVLVDMGKNEEAIQALNKSVELKPNYREALITLAQTQFKQAETKKDDQLKGQAVTTIKRVLEFIPNDSEVIDQLNQWGKQGVSTQSGKLK